MYLRKNRVRCGDTRRTYLSIAHNVWWTGEDGKRSQSRPVVVASFGVEDKVDIDLAREVVQAVESCVPKRSVRRGQGRDETMRVAQEIRKIEPFLKVLVSRRLALATHLPGGAERASILELLVREQLSAPRSGQREAEILEGLRGRLGA